MVQVWLARELELGEANSSILILIEFRSMHPIDFSCRAPDHRRVDADSFRSKIAAPAA